MICFVGGIAFYKHRQRIKAKAVDDANKLKQSAEDKAFAEWDKIRKQRQNN